jgi:phage-related protein
LTDLTSVFNRTFEEIFSLSDLIKKFTQLGITEQLNLFDIRDALLAVQFVESLLGSDSFSTISVYSRAFAEKLLGSDADVKLIEFVAADIENLLETFTKKPLLSREDVLKQTEVMETLTKFSRSVLDSEQILDKIYKRAYKKIELIENITEDTSKIPTKDLEDILTIADFSKVGFQKVFTDVVKIKDSLIRDVI